MVRKIKGTKYFNVNYSRSKDSVVLAPARNMLFVCFLLDESLSVVKRLSNRLSRKTLLYLHSATNTVSHGFVSPLLNFMPCHFFFRKFFFTKQVKFSCWIFHKVINITLIMRNNNNNIILNNIRLVFKTFMTSENAVKAANSKQESQFCLE